MWPFRRRPASGRHALGAAVTGIPSAPRQIDLPVAAGPVAGGLGVAGPSVAGPVVLPPVAPQPVASVPVPLPTEMTLQHAEGLLALAARLQPELLSEIADLLQAGETATATGPTTVDPALATVASPAAASRAVPSPDVAAGTAPLPVPPLSGLAVEYADLLAAPAQEPVEASLAVRAVARATTDCAVPTAEVPTAEVPTAEVPTAEVPTAHLPPGEVRTAGPAARSALEDALAALLPQQADDLPGPGHLVQLGFRDGSLTVLDPASEQSHALQEMARSLTQRDVLR